MYKYVCLYTPFFVTLLQIKRTKMNTSMHVSFQLKTSKVDEFGKAPIYTRITINGIRTEFSTKRYIEPLKWIALLVSKSEL